MALITGSALTFTVTVAVLLQPKLVPVTVYIVVIAGLAVTLPPVDADNEAAGAHV